MENFSDDQIDLNFQIKSLKFCFYFKNNGVTIFRLDAKFYLLKKRF